MTHPDTPPNYAGAQRVEVIGRATLLLGDCRDILPTLKRVDAVVTDPPYGIGQDKGANTGGLDGSGRYLRKPKQYEGGWDDERPSDETLAAVAALGRVAIIWGGNYFADALPRAGRWLFWDKQNTMPTFSDGEIAWTNLPGVSVKKVTRANQGMSSLQDGERVHPTQKPLAVMRWCLEFIPDAKLICDPYMGSGSTGVAAVQMGRDFIGIEREERYFDIACRRIEEAQKQADLFIPQPDKPKPVQPDLLGGA